MTVRRLHPVQPESFAFTAENRGWAEREVGKYPPGCESSAVIALLWRSQEQSGGWVTEPAIRHVADFLSMPYIRVLEIATFYSMFHLGPVGRTAHIQVCGTTPCMLRGAPALIDICRDRIAHAPHELSADGAFSWEEIECAGACVNAPMVQVGADTFEDLTPETFNRLLDDLSARRLVEPGPQVERRFSAPAGGATTLTTPEPAPRPALPTAKTTVALTDAEAKRPTAAANMRAAPSREAQPAPLSAPLEGRPDDLRRIAGIGPKIEEALRGIGVYHFSQIAGWTEDNAAWVDRGLHLQGRIVRDRWIEQARQLVESRAAADGGS